MRTENQERDYETLIALQKLYTAKRKLAKMAEQDRDEHKANRYWQQASGVRDAAMVLFGEDVLTDITI